MFGSDAGKGPPDRGEVLEKLAQDVLWQQFFRVSLVSFSQLRHIGEVVAFECKRAGTGIDLPALLLIK